MCNQKASAPAHTLVNVAQGSTVRLRFNRSLSERLSQLCLSDVSLVGVLASQWLIPSTISARLTWCSSLHSVCLHIRVAISYFQFWLLLRQPPTSYWLTYWLSDCACCMYKHHITWRIQQGLTSTKMPCCSGYGARTREGEGRGDGCDHVLPSPFFSLHHEVTLLLFQPCTSLWTLFLLMYQIQKRELWYRRYWKEEDLQIH